MYIYYIYFILFCTHLEFRDPRRPYNETSEKCTQQQNIVWSGPVYSPMELPISSLTESPGQAT